MHNNQLEYWVIFSIKITSDYNKFNKGYKGGWQKLQLYLHSNLEKKLDNLEPVKSNYFCNSCF